MHILEIPSFFPPYGGMFCLDQAKALAHLGHEVRILSNVQLGLTVNLKDFLKLPVGRFEHEMDSITVYQSYQRGLPRMVRHNVDHWVSIVCSMFDDYVKKYGKPDILHAHCAKWAGYAAMKISRKYGIPYVITEHLPLMLLEEEFGKAPSSAWQIPLLKLAYEQAATVLPVSEELVDDISCYYGKNYHWQYVSNTIDTDFYHYQERAPLEGRPFCFCCLADYYYRKGYDVLFDAYKVLQDKGLRIELHAAGLFTDGAKCKSDIERRSLRSVVTYGRLEKEGVRRLLYDCDALVLASRSEVQPLVLLEAMSTGIPVISTECIPQNLRIEDGCTIVPIDDVQALVDAMLKTIQRIACHPLTDESEDNPSERLSEKVRAMASPEVVGRKLEEIFKGLLS